MSMIKNLEQVNKELWLILALFLIGLFLNTTLGSNRMILGFYTIPTVVSAYLYGRRHATLTAVASVLFVSLMLYGNPWLTSTQGQVEWRTWIEVTVWGGTLIVTAYLMGTLYDHKSQQVQDLEESYDGIGHILQDFINRDHYRESHAYRSAMYASRIAAVHDMDARSIKNVHAAALLKDIVTLENAGGLLERAARLTERQYGRMQRHMDARWSLVDVPVASLDRILAILVSLQKRTTPPSDTGAQTMPEAQIIAVAEAYDALVSDAPGRRGLAPLEAKENLSQRGRGEFDPEIIAAFRTALDRGEFSRKIDSGRRWREGDVDVLSAIVEHPLVNAHPTLEVEDRAGVPRATRYRMRLPVMFRLETDTEWRGGTLANISRTGVLVDTGSPAVVPALPGTGAPIEVRLDLPTGIAGVPPAHVLCHGTLVRTARTPPGSSPSTFAVLVTDFRVGNDAEARRES